MKYCYIITEGRQDISFLERIFAFYQLQRVTKKSSLDLFWHELIPTTFPIKDNLIEPVPIPLFLQNSEFSIAIGYANGISNIFTSLEKSFANIDITKIFSIGIILDADEEKPEQRFNNLIDKNAKKGLSRLKDLGISIPEILGEFTLNFPRCGIFILPDNQNLGTLEDLLIKCSKVNYSDLLNRSKNYLKTIDKNQLNKQDLERLNKPMGEKKAVVSIIANTLRPGMSLSVSLRTNRWIDQETLQLPELILLQQFLSKLMGLEK